MLKPVFSMTVSSCFTIFTSLYLCISLFLNSSILFSSLLSFLLYPVQNFYCMLGFSFSTNIFSSPRIFVVFFHKHLLLSFLLILFCIFFLFLQVLFIQYFFLNFKLLFLRCFLIPPCIYLFLHTFFLFLTLHTLFKFLFCIGLQLIYNVVLVSGVQQSDSVIHIHTLFFSKFFSHLVYSRILSRVPCAIQQVLVGYLF